MGIVLSFKSDIRQKVEYQCNNCGKVRLLFISPALQTEKVTSHGYLEYVDVHICESNELSAIKLFVDAHYDVRSQVTIKSTKKDKEPVIQELQGLAIPIPKASKFLQQIIVPTKDFGSYNLKNLKIIDKLRQTDFIIEGIEDGNKIETSSPLEFIEIEANISSSLESEQVKKWMLSLANMIESLVVLDEKLLSYLGTYLDYNIAEIPKQKELLELDLLLNSTVAIPHSTQEHIDIFENHQKEIFPEISSMSYRIYKLIMTTCLNNEQKTLMNIYNEVKKQMIQIQAFPFFLSVISTLVSFGFINMEKLEFYTVQTEF